MTASLEIRSALTKLFASQRYVVLATADQGQPFASLMAFAASEDLRDFVLLTERSTRKFANLKANARVALLIDDRANRASDTLDSIAVTASGVAEEVEAHAVDTMLAQYLARHPNLAEFATLPSYAIVRVKVASYLLVCRFSRVLEWHLGP